MPYHIEKLKEPYTEVKKHSGGATFQEVSHPTRDELVRKINEIIDFLNTLTNTK